MKTKEICDNKCKYNITHTTNRLLKHHKMKIMIPYNRLLAWQATPLENYRFSSSIKFLLLIVRVYGKNGQSISFKESLLQIL